MMTGRQRLKQFLLTEIESFEDAPQPDKELLKVLYLAVDGLNNLDFGQSDEIFAPAKLGLRGARPATVKLCQSHAIGFVSLLKKRGKSVADAEDFVADGYGINADALRQWKKTISKTTDERLREIVKNYTRRTVKFVADPPIESVLAEVKRVGEIYKKARTPIVKKP